MTQHLLKVFVKIRLTTTSEIFISGCIIFTVRTTTTTTSEFLIQTFSAFEFPEAFSIPFKVQRPNLISGENDLLPDSSESFPVQELILQIHFFVVYRFSFVHFCKQVDCISFSLEQSHPRVSSLHFALYEFFIILSKIQV